MAGEPLTLEELIDRASDPTNTESNDLFATSVSNQVNRQIGGPQAAAKYFIQKLHLKQEPVTLQTLNVVERCAKDCGSKFHQEIGKYKFINELIKLLSPKYDGNITTQPVKDRIIKLFYSWCVGLPNEKKIAEAYKMLKQQGIIKKDPTEQAAGGGSHYSENTVFNDEENSELLKTLLSSSDPEDLQSANKLIKSLVKEEEKRLERVSERIQDLELVNNNVKLLEDMLAQNGPDSPMSQLEIMNELYESCLKMRPELFRLASQSAQDKDDSMAEILGASDELTRVIDMYKERILLQKVDGGYTKPYNVNTTENQQQQAPTSAAPSSSLLDFGFDAPVATATTSDSSLLDEQFKLLGLDAAPSESPQLSQQQIPFLQNQQQPQQQTLYNQPQQHIRPPFYPANILQQNQQQQNIQLNQQQQHYFMNPATSAAASQMSLIGNIRATSGNTSQQVVARPTNNVKSETIERKNQINNSSKSLLDFDVFSEFRTSTEPKTNDTPSEPKTTTNDLIDGANQSALNFMMEIPNTNTETPVNPSSISISLNHPPSTALSSTEEGLLSLSPPKNSPLAHDNSLLVDPHDQSENPQEVVGGSNTYLVPMEALKPAEFPPMPLFEKNGIRTLLNIVKDSREDSNKNVLVFLLSTVYMGFQPVTEFSVQVAVPKAMRVKLQPATSTQLAAYNPILPPATATQIMLIANPTREEVRLRLKILYTIDNVNHVETSSLENLPVR